MPNIRLQYGPILLGVCINMVLYGVLIVQTYHYYMTYKNDKLWIKLLVLYLFLVESMNTGCDVYIIYQPLIERFGLPEATKYFPTLFAAGNSGKVLLKTVVNHLLLDLEPITIVAVSTPIQLFFAWRVWLVTKSKMLPVIIIALALVSLAGGIWTTHGLIDIKLFIRKAELHTPALVWFLSACAADLLITSVLVFTLYKRKTGFVATDDVISKIIRITVQTGFVTTFFALGDVVFFMILPNTALNFIWDLALSKLYSNCLLSTLNARATLQLSTRSTNDYQSASRQITPGVTPRREGLCLDPMSPGRGYKRNTLLGNNATVQNFIKPPMYDVEAAETFDNHSDMEYGITITKVVETTEDPPVQNHTQ